MNDGCSPQRREIENRSLLLERGVLPLNHSTVIVTLLSTYVLRVTLQITDKVVPAYRVDNELSGRVTATVGEGTAMIHK